MLLVGSNPYVQDQKTACVSRYGAWGDAVFITPVLRKLKEEGYHVTLNCTERTHEILRRDPNVDLFMLQETNEVPNAELPEYWKKLADNFDKFVNLNGSIEGKLLLTPTQPEYLLSKEERHTLCNKNYMDTTMAIAGYPDAKGEQPALYFKPEEEEWAKKKLGTGFAVVVSMTGSSFHKIYPHVAGIVLGILEAMPEARVILVGEGGCKGIIDPHERLKDLCGEIGIRKSFALTKYANLVISTETSVAVAASCFDTPKIVLLSHASEENLTKYWRNCHTLSAPVSCFPCHKLHYDLNSCPTDKELNLPICASLLHPQKVWDAVWLVYNEFKRGKAA